jgi:molybdate transport system ATP-binding protein
MLEVAARRRIGDLDLNVRFSVAAGGVTALFGRSGAGKTSTVNLIAGLARPEQGHIALGGRVLFDSETGIDLPPERRRIGYVFQEGRLFPHMTVARNLAYGMRRAKSRDNRVSFDHIVELLGLGALLARHPATLSGGEKQRVAIGRAMLSDPDALLLDEPLASLDAPRKAEILPLIERLRDEMRTPIVYVSHVVEEIVRLADTVVLLSDGKIAAVGPLDTVMSRLDLRPLTGRYEAGAVIPAAVASHDEAYGLTQLSFAAGTLRVPRLGLAPGSRLRVRIRARDVALATEPPANISILNIFPGTVAEIAADGALADVVVDVGVRVWARITARSLHELGLAAGSQVYVLVKAVAIDRHSMGLSGAARVEDGWADEGDETD